jgi:hypothetical protein
LSKKHERRTRLHTAGVEAIKETAYARIAKLLAQ